jgi:voltage-gated potassium channel
VRPFTVVGLIAAEYIGQPVAFEAIYGMLTGEQEVTLDTLAIREGSALEGRSLAELDLKARRLVLFGVISRERREAEGVRSTYPLEDARLHFNPTLDFRLRQGDIVVVFGHRLSVLRFKQSVERIPGRGGWKTNREY